MKTRCCLLSLISVTALVIGSGCASQKSWVYSPNTYDRTLSSQTDVGEKTAAVLPFSDSREDVNKNRVLFYLVPLAPFGWADFEVPEGAAMHINSGLWVNYKPTEDYAKALAEELNSSGLFRQAYFDFRGGNSDYTIKGEIVSTEYKGKMITYGLSAFGPLLWLFGLPSSAISNDLTVTLTCIALTSNEVVISKTYNAPHYSKIGWIYALPSDFNYSSMLKDIYRDFVHDLANQLIHTSHLRSSR